jgi:1-acyl-sn-glycerol-3-phosphate acyltransferase
LFYKLLLFPARIFIHFYCRSIFINKKKYLDKSGPLLIASNHPNSFLDAIILATLFKKPIYSLARGDAFAGKLISKILLSLNMLPVYRISEGAENLENNYSTFDACLQIFKTNGIVLIFSEGRCINEWHLRPLKKGTARLAFAAWQQDIPLQVLPLGINYSGFIKFGKRLALNFGTTISRQEMNNSFFSGKAINEFNEKLKKQLQVLVYEIDKGEQQELRSYFPVRTSLLKKIILFIPAMTGYIIYAPLYYAIHVAIKAKAQDHYDSLMVGLLFFIYPLYVLLLTIVAFFITHNPLTFFLLIVIPVTALSVLHFKKE